MASFIFTDDYSWFTSTASNFEPIHKVSFLTAAINNIPIEREIILLPNNTQYMFLFVIKPT